MTKTTAQEPRCGTCAHLDKPPAESSSPPDTSTPRKRRSKAIPGLTMDFVDKVVHIVVGDVDVNKRRHSGTIVPQSLTFKPGYLTLLQATNDDKSWSYRSFPLDTIHQIVIDGRYFTDVQK